MFESFWQRYPRRVSKGAARKAYEKALKKAKHEEIMAGLERYRTHIAARGTEEQFVAHASTWLNQERWEDEYGLNIEKKAAGPNLQEALEAFDESDIETLPRA